VHNHGKLAIHILALLQMAIALESSMDNALRLRVDAALTNHEWAQLAQPLYFNESQALLDKAQSSLETVEASQKECQGIARRHGWL
jgi:hypothetical protein